MIGEYNDYYKIQRDNTNHIILLFIIIAKVHVAVAMHAVSMVYIHTPGMRIITSFMKHTRYIV